MHRAICKVLYCPNFTSMQLQIDFYCSRIPACCCLAHLWRSQDPVSTRQYKWLSQWVYFTSARHTANANTNAILPLLPYALLTCSISFFLFSFQVHEKPTLVPLLPLTLLFRVLHLPMMYAHGERWATTSVSSGQYKLGNLFVLLTAMSSHL